MRIGAQSKGLSGQYCPGGLRYRPEDRPHGDDQPRTVGKHREYIHRKLDVPGRTALLAAALTPLPRS
jgi:hypothetical protein